MTCPKCHGEMRQYERSGVTIDQCTECRGVFLDRGELEKLYDAEASWSAGQAAAPAAPAAPPAPAPQPTHAAPPPMPAPQPQHYQAPPPGYHGHYRYRGHYRKRRHGSFLSNLFD